MALPGKDDYENTAEGIHADRDEPFLVWIIVKNRDRELVMEHGRRIREIDPVLSQIRGGFSRIPLEIHGSSVCTPVHIVKRGLCGFPRDLTLRIRRPARPSY